MGHVVTGIIATPEALRQFAARHSLHAPVLLNAGLAMLPLRDVDLDSFLEPPQTGHVQGFTYLCEQLSRELIAASVGCAFMYFETDYFGGVGAQGAAVFRDGSLVFGPKSAKIGPINQALSMLGIRTVAPAHDEFETVGLHRHRHTEDWLDPEV
jgi:hypothetical protein